MRITVLLGNGFDVSFGIKSSYGDFYKWYCDKPSNIPHIQAFRNAIKEDILKDVPDDQKTWADFEVGLGQYTKNFTKETVDQFLECLDDAQAHIREYLLEQETAFGISKCTDESIQLFRKSLWDFYHEVSDLEKIPITTMLNNTPNQDREIAFVTFNYTDTLERILVAIPDEPLSTWKHGSSFFAYKLNRNILHVHGTTDSFPVLGVNDETQIANKELLETPQFKEMLIKAENVRALGMLWHNQAEELISNSRVVCILGMSIGSTDAKWWRKLVQWLKADGNRHIVLYWYEKNPPNGISTIKQLQTVDGAKNRLLSYTDKLSESDISALKNRIHVVINTTRYLRLEKKPVPPYDPMANVTAFAQYAAEHHEEIKQMATYAEEHKQELAQMAEALIGASK